MLVRDLIMKMQYFFSILVHARAWIRQSKYKVKATKEGSARIVNFMTIEAGGLMLERGYISHYSEYALTSTQSIYITLIAIVLSEYNAAFYGGILLPSLVR